MEKISRGRIKAEALYRRREGMDCMLALPPVRWRRRRVLVEWMGRSDRGNLEARRRHGLTRERSFGFCARMAIRRADQSPSLPEDAMTDKAIVGVDVSKDWIDVAVAGARTVMRLDNAPQAISAWLERSAPGVVAFEPTGGLRALARGLPRYPRHRPVQGSSQRPCRLP